MVNTLGIRAYRLASTLAVLLVPDLIRFRSPFWEQDHAAQAPLLALAFVAALWVTPTGGGARLIRNLLIGLSVVAATAAAVVAVGTLWPAIPLARSTALLSVAFSAVLLTGDQLLRLPTTRLTAAAFLLIGTGGVVAWPVVFPDTSLPAPRVVFSILEPLELVHHGRQVAAEDVHRGGGFERLGEQVVVMSGNGALYRLDWTGDATPMRSHRLPIGSPVDLSVFDESLDDPIHPETVRAMDLASRLVEGGWQLFASHHQWNDSGRCVTVVVSVATLSPDLDRVVDDWSTLAESRPCLPFGDSILGGNFAGHISGGRMAWLAPDQLLLTIGDHGLDVMGRPAAGAQLDDYDYGKTRVIDVATGVMRPFTKGQRNAQGLYVAPDGRIWSTEHGPRGGDELNLVVEGRNYGWPYATFGTDYGQLSWPPAETPPADSSFALPQYAWLPSVATSALIGIEATRFPKWRGNLMIASLAGRALHRVHLEGDQVMYSERIPIGEEIRDLVEGPDGNLWLWNDQGLVLTVSPAPAGARGAVVFTACTSCHSLEPDGGGSSLGPSLSGVVGRAVAAVPDYPSYSPALRAAGGRWTADRLDAFLTDPTAFAPGTTMLYSVATQADREAVIAFLAGR